MERTGLGPQPQGHHAGPLHLIGQGGGHGGQALVARQGDQGLVETGIRPGPAVEIVPG
jgi:hypothetical protein